jgi:hypothetical protein
VADGCGKSPSDPAVHFVVPAPATPPPPAVEELVLSHSSPAGHNVVNEMTEMNNFF